MWIFNKDGFFSIVQKPNQVGTDQVTVRARNKIDLLNALEAMGIDCKRVMAHGGTDYEYRIVVSKNQWAEYVNKAVADIDYDNFKHEIEERDPERADVYLGVWSAMLRAANRRDRR